MTERAKRLNWASRQLLEIRSALGCFRATERLDLADGQMSIAGQLLLMELNEELAEQAKSEGGEG